MADLIAGPTVTLSQYLVPRDSESPQKEKKSHFGGKGNTNFGANGWNPSLKLCTKSPPIHQMYLVAGTCVDPVGELTALPEIPN